MNYAEFIRAKASLDVESSFENVNSALFDELGTKGRDIASDKTLLSNGTESIDRNAEIACLMLEAASETLAMIMR